MNSIDIRRVRIVGLARDVETNLAQEVFRLRKIFGEIFEQVEFYIIESDSKDNTVELLKILSSQISDFGFHSHGNLEPIIPNRIARLIHCRNSYVDWLRKQPTLSHIAVVDFDIKNSKLKAANLKMALNDLPSAAAIFTNQSGRYFDIYALRCPNWSEADCFSEYSELRKTLNPDKAKKIAIWSKMRKISSKTPPISVDSAFGGLAIYQDSIFRNFDYSPEQEILGESEHVYLHRKLRAAGLDLYIHPQLRNFGWNPHNLSSFRFFRLIDQLSKSPQFWRIRRVLRDAVR